MKRILITLLVLCTTLVASADTTLTFGFDNNAVDNGIQHGGVDQLMTFSGAVVASGQTNFNLLDGENAVVNFSIGSVGALSSFSGTLTPYGGDFNMGGNGGGIDGPIGTGADFDDSTEYWTFTFSADVMLTEVDYYGPFAAQQTIVTNGVHVSGSPFNSDISSESIFVKAGDSLTFGHAGTANDYDLDTFTVKVVPEPATIAMFGIGGFIAFVIRRSVGK